MTSPNINIDELLKNKPYRACQRCGNEWFSDLGMVSISIKEAEEANDKYLKPQLEALLSAAKEEGFEKGYKERDKIAEIEAEVLVDRIKELEKKQ